MHVLRLVRVLIPVAIVAVIVGAGASVLSARPDLRSARRDVDGAWTTLAPQLDSRYQKLQAVDDGLRNVAGPVATLVADVGTALNGWRDARAHGSVAAQVTAANDVEALGRRLLTTAGASPRLQGDQAVLVAVQQFLDDGARRGAAAFNDAVGRYEHERRGPVRSVVASVLGDDPVPMLDTTEPAGSTPAS